MAKVQQTDDRLDGYYTYIFVEEFPMSHCALIFCNRAKNLIGIFQNRFINYMLWIY